MMMIQKKVDKLILCHYSHISAISHGGQGNHNM